MVKDPISILKSGPLSFNYWRKQNEYEPVSYSGIKLEDKNLSYYDFKNSDFSEAYFDGGIIGSSNFYKSVFRNVNFNILALGKSYFFDSIFNEAKFNNVFFYSNIVGLCSFIKAEIENADISQSYFGSSILSNASFKNSELNSTVLYECLLSGCDFTNTKMSSLSIINCNLADCVGLDTIIHKSPNNIDINTLIQTYKNSKNKFDSDIIDFFIYSGVPKNLIDMIPRIASSIKYHDVFICYGEPDKAFAERLVKELRSRNVNCWMYSMDATPGRRIWHEIKEKRQMAGKMVVICSSRSLVRDGVKKEIDEQIDESPEKLIPISLDNLWQQNRFKAVRGKRDIKLFLLERTYADFSNEKKFEASIRRLLNGLKL